MILLLLLLILQERQSLVPHCQLAEVNHVYDENGVYCNSTLLAWDWDDDGLILQDYRGVTRQAVVLRSTIVAFASDSREVYFLEGDYVQQTFTQCNMVYKFEQLHPDRVRHNYWNK